jgi:hypothetical protein
MTTGTANRSADQCMVTSSTSQFALKMNDGRTVRFDMVGNQRAQEKLQSNKKWTQAATTGKEIKVTVNGAMSGDKLVVSSIK